MACIGTSTLVIETNTLRLIHFCHFCGKKVKHESEKPKHARYYSSTKTNPNQTLFPPWLLMYSHHNWSLRGAVWYDWQSEATESNPDPNPCLLHNWQTYATKFNPNLNPYLRHDWWTKVTKFNLTHIFDMIGEPRWPSSTLTLTHFSYMIREPKRLSSTLTLIHIFYMIGEPRQPSSTLTLTHIFYIHSCPVTKTNPNQTPFCPPPTHKYLLFSS